MDNLTPTGYRYIPTNYDEFEQMVQAAQNAKNGAAFALGDLWLHGEEHFTNICDQAFDETKITLRTVRNYAVVAKSIDQHRRRSELSFSHHAAVAKLPPQAQDELLGEAVNKQLSRDELRDRVRERQGQPEKVEPIKSECRLRDILTHLTQDYGLQPDDMIQFSVKVVQPAPRGIPVRFSQDAA